MRPKRKCSTAPLLAAACDVEAARSVLGFGPAGPILELPPQVTEAMIAHARFTYPEEACGLLAVDDSGDVRMVYCLTNVERSRYRFTVDPNEHYRAWRHAERNGWEIGGAFHSHPATAAHPSSTDISGALDPTWIHVIVGLADPEQPEVRFTWWPAIDSANSTPDSVPKREALPCSTWSVTS